jgi:CheY-like chemotaxis protein
MMVLIAEDDPVTRRLLEVRLTQWGYPLLVTSNGQEAWDTIQQVQEPLLVLLDWMMPKMDGIDVCRQIRDSRKDIPTHVIFLTARGAREDILRGFEAGADDYLQKPFDHEELRARVRVGERILLLEHDLAQRVRQLEEALEKVKSLEGLLPICSCCKKIRNDRDYWQEVEQYVGERSKAQFSHGVCLECLEKHVKPELERVERELASRRAGQPVSGTRP